MNCWFASCGQEILPGTPSGVYCAKHWAELTDTMDEVIKYIGEGAASLYVGRTNYPERRLLEHLRDRNHDKLAVLHWSAHRHEIEAVERATIALVKRSFPRKGTNVDDESSGPRSGPWHAAYISWREKSRTSAVPVRWRVVRHLDEAPLAPTPGFLSFPIFLQAHAERERVNAIIQDRYGAIR